ncbi:MAG: hypothetical protein ACLUV3_09305 [Oscillospiraceae bacterium]|jgi:hypothetical protein
MELIISFFISVVASILQIIFASGWTGIIRKNKAVSTKAKGVAVLWLFL